MSGPAPPEVWLRGPIDGVARELMPVVHSLLQVRDELQGVPTSLSRDRLWRRPGGGASVGFHLRHLTGSLDRLMTYARGESLTGDQQAFLAAEGTPGPEEAASLIASAQATIDRAIAQVRGTAVDTLFEPRAVGRARLPSTVIGLLFHAAEHTQRHAGQVATMLKVVTAPDD